MSRIREIQEELATEVGRIYQEVYKPVATKCSFPLRAAPGDVLGGPMVLLIGNHSSGKSTFINYLLGENVQRTGMAPTDDCFTLLRHGLKREERDGRALVSNPELPFGDVARFGPEFLSHFRMRLLPLEPLHHCTLVDTPGMIDAADPSSGRGYDFPGVVRWFADRADLVLVFFDPERPGTTTETLQVLTRLIGRIDDRLLIVMNKMDQFRSLRDFARCYGTLCWNLGKVVHKKDMPQIFTTYVPVPGAPEAVVPLEDFATARDELIHEIKRAPVRRVDNLLSGIERDGQRLSVHMQVVREAWKEMAKLKRRIWAGIGVLGLASLAWAGYMAWQEEYLWTALGAGITAMLLVFGGAFVRWIMVTKDREMPLRTEALFEAAFHRQLVLENRGRNLTSIWEEIAPDTRRILSDIGVKSIARIKEKDHASLRKILEQELPDLRKSLHRKLGETSYRSQYWKPSAEAPASTQAR